MNTLKPLSQMIHRIVGCDHPHPDSRMVQPNLVGGTNGWTDIITSFCGRCGRFHATVDVYTYGKDRVNRSRVQEITHPIGWRRG